MNNILYYDTKRDTRWMNISFCFEWPIMLKFQICILTMACEL